MLRKNMGKTAYYPIFDRTEDFANRTDVLAIAAVDPTTWDVKGLIRADNPKIKPTLDEMAVSINQRLGLMSIPKAQKHNNSRYIPDSQKPDFMRQEKVPEDSAQYE